MYASLGRRGGHEQPADGRDRRELADLHTGSARDFLRRHGREAAEAARSGKRARFDFAQLLFRRAADTRNLKLALDHLASEGGGAPGPDGVCPTDLGPAERWELGRALGDSIRRATYRPGPGRVVTIPKGNGRGHRTLIIQDLQDRAVQRAILQVLQPFVDPRFLDTSFGSRPGLGREHALARAAALAEVEGSWTWVAEDIQDAFNQVPLNRLLDVVRTHAPADDFMSLVDTVIRNATNRGLRQGGALSPLLSNVYLDRCLDRPWRKQNPRMPLLRVVDDLLVLTRDEGESVAVQTSLRSMLVAAGMQANASKGVNRDLAAGHSIDWLGYTICKGGQGVEPRLSERSWERLTMALSVLHAGPNAPIRALETIEGWLDQAGPCYVQNECSRVCERIAVMARLYAFEELPDHLEVRARWVTAFRRWERLRRQVRDDDR
jgi:hypothetical protein